MPNTTILINTLLLQEAKDSSAVESIITTHDELYKAELSLHTAITAATKEVQSYSAALIHGFELVQQHGLLTCNDMIEIYRRIKHNQAGYRVTPGTALINDRTGESVYQPPQSYDEIVSCMSNLEKFINDNSISDLDPLVKMCIIHHQFESIHPFAPSRQRQSGVGGMGFISPERIGRNFSGDSYSYLENEVFDDGI